MVDRPKQGYIDDLILHGVCGLQTMCPQYISLAKMGCHFGSRIRTLILQDQRLSKVLVVVSH